MFLLATLYVTWHSKDVYESCCMLQFSWILIFHAEPWGLSETSPMVIITNWLACMKAFSSSVSCPDFTCSPWGRFQATQCFSFCPWCWGSGWGFGSVRIACYRTGDCPWQQLACNLHSKWLPLSRRSLILWQLTPVISFLKNYSKPSAVNRDLDFIFSIDGSLVMLHTSFNRLAMQ